MCILGISIGKMCKGLMGMKLYNCDVSYLKKIVSKKRMICFGAGRALRNFISFYEKMNFIDNIFCIVDNNNEKLPDKIHIKNIDIPIIGIEELRKMEDYILLISCHDICGVYEQLSKYPELNEIPCFASNFVRAETNRKEEEEREYPSNYRITEEQLIPKRIHYCWFGKGEIPQQNQKWMESWRKYCPDYEIIRWDESNYDVTKNRYMYEAYQAGKWGFVPDYARMDIIYNHGGIYLDTDVELLRSLDELLYQKAFAGIEASRKINLGLGFGAHKGCKIVREIRDLYLEKSFGEKEDNLTAAPDLQKKFFNRKGYINNGEYQVIEGLTIYPEKVLSGKCNFTGEIIPTKHTFSIHHYDGSWTPQSKTQNLKNAKLFKRAINIDEENGNFYEELL